MPRQRARRPDDKRLKANRPPSKASRAPKSRYQQLIDGTLTVEDLDDEEIFAGKCKDKDGTFRGRPPKTFPRALHEGMRREFQKRIQEKWNEGADLAFATLQDVMASRHAAAPARVRAAEIWIERFAGKVPDKLEQTIELKPFEEDVESLLVDVPTPDNVTPIKKRKTG